VATGDNAIACDILALRCVPVGTVGNLAIGARNGCFDSRATVCKKKGPGSVWVCLLPAKRLTAGGGSRELDTVGATRRHGTWISSKVSLASGGY
jgi:hypothetical protein